MLLTAAIMIMAGFSTRLFAQTNTANTTAGAKIVEGLTLAQVTALHFGTMTIPTTIATVSVSTAAARSSTGTITLLTQTPTFTNASYTVSGTADSFYTIELPADGVVTISKAGAPSVIMHVNGFTALATSSATAPKLNGSGADSFVVGATLELEANQQAGVYAGTFDVTVNYN